MNIFGQLVFKLIGAGIIIGVVSCLVLACIGWLIVSFWEEKNGED